MKQIIFILCFGVSLSGFASSESDLQEILYASEGAPSHITDNATFLKFQNDRFVEIKAGGNNFTCLVVREPKGRYEPSCLNEQAVRSILPAYELHMALLFKGLSYEETHTALNQSFKEGKLPTAEPGALVYMMSPNNKFYSNGQLVTSPIHQMYFYPKLEDKVFSLGDGSVALWQGFPHLSALIVVVPGAESNNMGHGAH